MSIAKQVLLLALCAGLLSACEKWSWPPYEKSLRELFAEHHERFDEIRQNMLADNLEIVDSSHAWGRHTYSCAGDDCPATIDEDDEELQEKYRRIVEERSIFRYTLFDGDFYVRGPSFPAQGGDFYVDFAWPEDEPSIPHCDENKARLPTCGACYEDLQPNWYLLWRWFPQDLGPDWDGSIGEGLPNVEEIQQQHREALDECLEAGRGEMGLERPSE